MTQGRSNYWTNELRALRLRAPVRAEERGVRDPSPVSEADAKRRRELREELGMSKLHASAASGVTYSLIDQAERPGARLTSRTAKRVDAFYRQCLEEREEAGA